MTLAVLSFLLRPLNAVSALLLKSHFPSLGDKFLFLILYILLQLFSFAFLVLMDFFCDTPLYIPYLPEGFSKHQGHLFLYFLIQEPITP